MSMTKRFADRLATAYFWFIGLFIVFVLAWFLYKIVSPGLPHISWHFLTSQPESGMSAGGGIAPNIFNTFYILLLSLAVSLPIGIGAGVYLAVYAKAGRFTDTIRISVESLASVPSIVFGLFGLLLFVQWLGFSFSIVSGALTLALLNLPVLVSVTEVSLRAVPGSYLDASLALGSTRWQAIRKVLLPSALPGLITGITLVAGRAVGETALLIYTAGQSVSRYLPDFDLRAMGETLSVHLLYVQSTALVPDAKEIAQGSAAVLVFIVLFLNLLIVLPTRYLQRKLSGK